MNTDADDISMLAEIQTDTDDLSAIEFEKEIPIMPFAQYGHVSIGSHACNYRTPQYFETGQRCI